MNDCMYTGAECLRETCMAWEQDYKDAPEVECHRCHATVPTTRNTCPKCDAFIKGYGAKVPRVPAGTGRCKMIPMEVK
jgi:hypothetical protein